MAGLRFPHRRAFGFLLFPVLILAAAARFHEIGRRSVWFDEGLTLGVVRISIGDLLAHLWNPTLNNQVFYYLALRPWHLLGDDISIVRGFSAVASIAAVGLACVLARRLFGTTAALAAGVLLAVHWGAIRYAQEARGYALATACSCLAAFLLMRAVEHGRRRDVVGWAVASGLAMYSHSFAVFVVASQILSLVALGPRALRRRTDLMGGVAGIALLVAPIAWSLGGASHKLISWMPPMSADYFVQQTRFLAGGTPGLPYYYLIVLGVLVFEIARERDPVTRWGHALCICWATGPLLALAAISLWSPVLLSRYLVMSIPAWTLAAGAATSVMTGSRRRLPVAFALIALPLVSELTAVGRVYRDGFEDWKTPAMLVAAEARPGDAILYDSSWSAFALEYYLERSGAPQPARLQHGELLFSNAFDNAEAAAAARVWLVLSREDIVRSIRMEALLEGSHSKVSSKYAGDLRVMLYERDQREARQ